MTAIIRKDIHKNTWNSYLNFDLLVFIEIFNFTVVTVTLKSKIFITSVPYETCLTLKLDLLCCASTWDALQTLSYPIFTSGILNKKSF